MATPQPFHGGRARAPFDNPVADTILQSSNGVHFRVHSIIVAEASHVFADMFALPQPPRAPGAADDDSADYVGDTPVVRLEEDSAALDCLLRLCYPVPDPDVQDPDLVRRVLAAALKYEMEEAAALMRRTLRLIMRTRPLQAWAIACSLGLHDEAIDAALTLCGTGMPDDEPALLRLVTAGQYFRLLKYVATDGGDGEEDESFCFTVPNPAHAVPETRWSCLPQLETGTLTLEERPFVDVVCRASHGAALLSHKAVLAAASPVLRDRLLKLDHGNAEALPILEFDEPSRTLSTVLELCYPVQRPCLSPAHSLRDICAATAAAEKYEMALALRTLRGAFLHGSYPALLRAYLLAAHAGIATYVHEAERAILRRGQAPLDYGWFEEMETVPAPAFHRLAVKYRAVERVGFAEYDQAARKRRRIEEGW